MVLSLLSPRTGLTEFRFPQMEAGGEGSGWFESTTFIMRLISVVTASDPPQIVRHQIPETGDPCSKSTRGKVSITKTQPFHLCALVSSAHSSPLFLSILNCNVFTCFYYRIGNSLLTKTVLAPPCSWCLANN